MRTKYLAWSLIIILLTCLIIYYFNQPNKGQVTFTNLSQRTCVPLKKGDGTPLMVSRYVKIIKNTLQDTVSFGGAVLGPKETGKRADRLFIDSKGQINSYYFEEEVEENKIDKICVSLYLNRPAKGELVIEYYYE